MMRNFARAVLERRSRLRLERACDTTIDPTAKVAYRKLALSPPGTLRIGAGSIVEGIIAADRAGSTVVIGRNTFIGGSRLITADRITIGDDVLISWGCTIVDHNSHAIGWDDRKDDVRDWYNGRKSWDKVKISPVTIENKVWIGFNSIILAGVTVGEGAVVGCGSIVTKDVAPFTVVAGSPARPIRKITRE